MIGALSTLMMTPETSASDRACCAPQSSKTRDMADGPVRVAARSSEDHGLIALTGGSFLMGAADGPHPQDGEGPVRRVTLDGFSIASLTITNAQFQRFFEDTGYRTVAEQVGTSFVFELLLPMNCEDVPRAKTAPWWCEVSGACWHHPEGPFGESVRARPDHPVVHISLADAHAYCEWSGMILPTEAQWEYASRGGLEAQPFPWGDSLEPEGVHRSNVWQGQFPKSNTAEDGFVGTAPSKCYAPNGFGLFGMTGNIWEWTADRFTTLHSPRPQANPSGPLNGDFNVAKGGSYLCHSSYCQRYRTSSRQALDPFTTAGNLGFRVARNEGIGGL